MLLMSACVLKTPLTKPFGPPPTPSKTGLCKQPPFLEKTPEMVFDLTVSMQNRQAF